MRILSRNNLFINRFNYAKGRTKWYRNKPLMFLFTALITCIALTFAYWLHASSVVAESGSAVLWPDNDYGTTNNFAELSASPDTSCAGGTHCDHVDESGETDYLGTGVDMDSTTAEEEFGFANPSVLGTLASVNNVELTVRAATIGGCNGTGGTPCDNLDARLYIDGAYNGTTKTLSLSGSATATDYTVSWSGLTDTTADDLRIEIVRVVNGGGNASIRDDDIRIYEVSVDIDYTYIPDRPELVLDGYIWENASDSSAALAAGSTSISDVRKGDALKLRTQIYNQGTGALANDLALFYDKNDGIWTKVDQPDVVDNGSDNCDTVGGGSDAWECETVDVTNSVAGFSSIAIDPFGNPWVAYEDVTSGNLEVAQYVGSGGNCDTVGAGSDAWSCTTVDATDALGNHLSIAFGQGGKPWISYYDLSSGNLEVAHYVGSGGNCDTVGAGSDAWECTTVDATDNVGQDTAIAIDILGNPWVSYFDNTNGNLEVAKYVGSGGNCDTVGGGSDAWECTTIDATNVVGQHTSIAFDHAGDAWVSYYDNTNANLEVAKYVGSGGNCDTVGAGSDAWNCTTVDVTGVVGQHTSIAFDPAGDAWVSYQDFTGNLNLEVAKYVGSGGNCDTVGAGSDAWECTTVDATDAVGYFTSIAFDPAGNAWVSHFDFSVANLEVAHYVGSGGNCDTVGAGSDAWECTTVDATDDVGREGSIAIDANGNPWISYRDLTGGNLEVARVSRSSEITLATGSETAITTSHADMTSVTDTTNKSDADCITSGTWNNGKHIHASHASSVSLPIGSTTKQCTEIAWTIDTSQATPGQTYRFIVAEKGSLRPDKGLWRGPVSVSAYPTLTITPESELRYSQGFNVIMDTNLSPTGWAKTQITGHTTEEASAALDPAGNPWVSYRDARASVWNLEVAQYVGSGGNCDNISGGSDAWECTTVDATDNVGDFNSMGFDPAGNPWVSYRDVTYNNLEVARYVGSGGNCDEVGGGSDAWHCTTVDATDMVGWYTSIAFDPAGNPWVSYYDGTNDNLEVATYVGSGGNCDTVGAGSDAWECTTIDATDDVGLYTSIAFDPAGNPWVSYSDNTNGNLEVARYVGFGGNCDTVGGGSDAWECTTIDATDNVGFATSIAFDSAGDAWISYRDNTNANLEVARYVGSGGNCDTVGAGSDAWNCTTVDVTDNLASTSTSLAFDLSGNAWVSYNQYNTSPSIHYPLQLARYVGSGGNCDTVGAGSDAWECTELESGYSTGNNTSILFDAHGLPWVFGASLSSTYDLSVAKLDSINFPPNLQDQLSYSRNARNAEPNNRYTNGSATGYVMGSFLDCDSDNGGYCAVASDNGEYQTTTTTGPYQQPYSMFIRKFDSNSTVPTITWTGKTSLSPSSSNIKMDIYRHGTTNAWESLATNSSSTACVTANCTISGMPANTPSEYFELIDGSYYMYVRVYQEHSTTATITFQTDMFDMHAVSAGLLRHNKAFREGALVPGN